MASQYDIINITEMEIDRWGKVQELIEVERDEKSCELKQM
jgi:hypothetical protein